MDRTAIDNLALALTSELDEDTTGDIQLGVIDFFHDAPLITEKIPHGHPDDWSPPENWDDWRYGWWLAHRYCYGQGVVAGLNAQLSGEEAESPYDRKTGPGEAWADGHDWVAMS